MDVNMLKLAWKISLGVKFIYIQTLNETVAKTWWNNFM